MCLNLGRNKYILFFSISTQIFKKRKGVSPSFFSILTQFSKKCKGVSPSKRFHVFEFVQKMVKCNKKILSV